MSEADWDRILRQLYLKLVPSDADVRDAKAAADQLFRILQQNGRYSVDRLAIFGSLAKKTSIGSSFDVDCVAHINNITIRDFPTVFNNFRSFLQCRGYSCEMGKMAMKTTVGRFDVDIAPAINYSQDDVVQRQRAWDAVKRAPESDRRKYSTSLTTYQTEFMRMQSSYVHELTRVAKYWSKKIPSQDKIHGQSTIFELIAIQAGKSEENYGSRSLYRGFRRFLEMVQQFRSLNIIFVEFYSLSEVPFNIKQQRPLVLDPSNPYDNMAYDLSHEKPHLITVFIDFATDTLRKMNRGRADLSAANLD